MEPTEAIQQMEESSFITSQDGIQSVKSKEKGLVSMGFIDWHKTKENHYQEVLDYAKEKEKETAITLEKQKLQEQYAKIFGVPELLSLKTNEILKILLKEKKWLDIFYNSLLERNFSAGTVQADPSVCRQFYYDFFLYSVDHLLEKSPVERLTREKFVSQIMEILFQEPASISTKEHYERISNTPAYSQYLKDCFSFQPGKPSPYWQWMKLLSQNHTADQDSWRYGKVTIKFLFHMAFYMNQLLPEVRAGLWEAEHKTLIYEVIKFSFTAPVNQKQLLCQMKNPIFSIHEEEKRRKDRSLQDAIRKKEYIRFVRYANIIPGSNLQDTEDETDMITAGQLYKAVREQKLLLEPFPSIFPADSANLAESGSLPVLLKEHIPVKFSEEEALHYMDYGIRFTADFDSETIEKEHGILYITSQQIRFEGGKSAVAIPLKELKKAVVYDAIPEIIEALGEAEPLFIQTADVKNTYQILKLILHAVEEPDAHQKEETLSLDFLKTADLPAYRFGIKSLITAELSEEMATSLQEMLHSLEYLDKALTNYPDHKAQSDPFFSYYIPEAVRLLYSYQEYKKSGIPEAETEPLYESVHEAVKRVCLAAKQLVCDIYRAEMLDTTARAQALTDILGQDGYLDFADYMKGK